MGEGMKREGCIQRNRVCFPFQCPYSLKKLLCVLFVNIYLKPFNIPFWEDQHLEKNTKNVVTMISVIKMLFMVMVQGFYISRYIIADSGLVTPLEKNIMMNKFQMSAYRSFLCLHSQVPLAQSPHLTGAEISRFLPHFFFWLQHKHFQCFLNGINIFRVSDSQ